MKRTRDEEEIQELERVLRLASDSTPLERLLAYEPKCAAAGRHKNRLLAEWGRRLGIGPPWG